jgi:hypothetical protein
VQHLIKARAVNTDDPYVEGTVFVRWECVGCEAKGEPQRVSNLSADHERIRDAIIGQGVSAHEGSTRYATPREARTAAALGAMVDKSGNEESLAIDAELRSLAERAWGLRARVVDLRGIRVTFVVSGKAFGLLGKHPVDIGLGGPVFEAEPVAVALAPNMIPRGLLFGTPCIWDMPDSRHTNVSLILEDDGEGLRAQAESIDMSKVRGLGTDDAS